MAGYHLANIPKGVYGCFSKVEEEWTELLDARQQNNSIMEICELSDLLGAIEAHIEKWGFTLDDLIKMKEATKKAFKEGYRK